MSDGQCTVSITCSGRVLRCMYPAGHEASCAHGYYGGATPTSWTASQAFSAPEYGIGRKETT